MVADYAIDGNRNNDLFDCAHTDTTFSYWSVEFERIETVSHVIVFFRNQISKNFRNTEMRLLISSTRNESDNNVGTDCAYYDGPPESPSPPVKISCNHPVAGKFLKIIHYFQNKLVLCEVEVYHV
ncbi:fucolectin-3-like [Ruditapes philippinarum]|uniref:fucolectin-3-like n=1 Tax=Ruditapes philippinarum TaxID=129788 RepID=UPI00295BD16C|nr:fucolectin-3-like [Ruditapes philippinarum]